MTRFVPSLDGGWIAASAIARVTFPPVGRGYLAHGTDGKVLGRLDDDFDPEAICAPLVPAAAGERVRILYADAETLGRPTHVSERTARIVAWRLLPDGPEPVITPIAADDDVVLVPLPDGHSYVTSDGEVFSTLETARAQILADAQARWDRRNKTPGGAE